MASDSPVAELLRGSGSRPSPGATEVAVFRDEGHPPGKARRKLWQLPHRFHCAVIGTCLDADELRRLTPELGLGDPQDLSDYDIHVRFVGHAAEKNPVSQRLQGLLDRQYRGALRRYRRLREAEDLRRQWRTDMEEGRIAGAFWALVSHPATPADLAYELNGEIHMLGHQVGAGIRSGLRRLPELERENQDLREQLQKAEEQAHQYLTAKQHLRQDRDYWRARALRAENRTKRTEERLTQWEQGEYMRRLRSRMRLLEREAEHQRRRAERAEKAAHREGPEADTEPPGEAPSARPAAPSPRPQGSRPDLRGSRVLCVGGRKGISDHYRRLVEQANGHFLHHDGGIEQGSDHLEQMLARADQVVCPTDCVGHQAVRCVKEHCKRADIPCRFLESASVSALANALPQLPVAAEGKSAGAPAQ